MSMDQAALMAALQSVIDPNTGKDFVSTKLLKNLRAQGASVSFDVTLGYPARSQIAPIRQMLEDAARSVPGVQQATANVDFKIIAHSVQRGVPLLPGVKNMIAVASGKGGVGKSTTAANLALALAAEGARVGMLDADIYGPSQPTMMGVHGSPEHDGQAMQPLIGHGVQVNSIGLMVKQGQAMIWRGPMVTQALDQLMRQTAWHDVDYLIVDMPPGTGDVQLSISQRAPVTGAVIVTTPQDIALMDARRGIACPFWAWWKTWPCTAARCAGMKSTSSARAAASAWPRNTRWTTWAACPCRCPSASRPTAAAPPWWPRPTAPRPPPTAPLPAASP